MQHPRPDRPRGRRRRSAESAAEPASPPRDRALAFARATRDPVTGLPGPALFRDRLEHALRDAQRTGEAVGLVLLEVREDDGSGSPPERLARVAERLRASVRRGDTVARLPGPHFAAVLAGLGRSRDALGLAERLVGQAEGAGFPETAPRVRAGVAVRPAAPGPAAAPPAELLAEAAAALEAARRSPRGAAAVAPPHRQDALPRLEGYLRRALRRGEVGVVYQPELCLRTRRIVAVEALVRWRHPTLGAIAPERFLPEAERIGILAGIGRFVRTEALGLRRRLGRAGVPAPRIALNASPAELARPSFAGEFLGLLRRSGQPRGRVEIEVTEEQALPPAAVDTLLRLHEAGVRILVDDFGRGHAGLATLRRIPADAIKLDRTLVEGLGADRRGGALVRALVAAARRLGLEVIAEGVETEAQREALRALGVARIQGYLVAPPLPEAELRARLAAEARSRLRVRPPPPAP